MMFPNSKLFMIVDFVMNSDSFTIAAFHYTVPDLSVCRPFAGSLLEAPTHPQML